MFDTSSYWSPSASTPPVASATTEQPSALVTAIGGDAYATGTLTDANGVVSNTIKDLGNVTIASGYATFEASGTSATPGGASAHADTFLAVTGADFVVEFTFDRTVDWMRNALHGVFKPVDAEGPGNCSFRLG